MRLRRAFTILELLVVISILGILMGMVASVMPDTKDTESQALIMRLSMAIESYKSSFYVYPRSDDNGYNRDDGTLVGPRDLYRVLVARDMVQRDGKYIEQLYKPESDVEYRNANSSTYFVDGWDNKIVYYSGVECFTENDPGSVQVIPAWLRATGKADVNPTTFTSSRYRPEDFYFLGSAGPDQFFYYDVISGQSGAPSAHTPNNYLYLTSGGGAEAKHSDVNGPQSDGTSQSYEQDDIWAGSLGSKYN